MRGACRQLADIERLADDEVVDRVRCAEVEAEQLCRPQPPRIEHLTLLDDVAAFDVTVVMHVGADEVQAERSEEHTSELQSLMRISSAVFCLKKTNQHNTSHTIT